MHASCVTSGSIDFLIFECFLKGYEIDEAVEFLMQYYQLKKASADECPFVSLKEGKEEPEAVSGLPQNSFEVDGNEDDVVKEYYSLNNISNGTHLGENDRGRSILEAYTTATGQRCYVQEEVVEQYRLFKSLVKHDNYLKAPYAFLTSSYIPISIADRLKIVNIYYDYEPVIFRLFFGNKCAHSTERFREEINTTVSKAFHSPTSDFLPTLRAQIEAIEEGVVKRQIDNFRHVSATITGMYQCKGDRFIPKETPLQLSIERCFGFNKALAAHYAAAVFSYEHALNSRFFDCFKTCDMCFSVYSLIAACWCDNSGLFLNKKLKENWKAVGRHLEDNRVLGDIHMEFFGELLKPRWQQQLDDGVQRVMGGSSYNDRAPAAGEGSLQNHSDDRNHSSRMKSPSGRPSSPSSGPVGGQINQFGMPMCSNLKYSKRICFEFGLIMKVCSRVALLLSSGQLNDALDYYYTRVLHVLEGWSIRDAPDLRSGFHKPSEVVPPSFTEGQSPKIAGFASVSGFIGESQEDLTQKKNRDGTFVHSSQAPSESSQSTNGRFRTLNSAKPTNADPGSGHSFSRSGELKRDVLGSPLFPDSVKAAGGVAGIVENAEKIYLVELCFLLTKLRDSSHILQMSNEGEKEAFRSMMTALKSLTQLVIAVA